MGRTENVWYDNESFLQTPSNTAENLLLNQRNFYLMNQMIFTVLPRSVKRQVILLKSCMDQRKSIPTYHNVPLYHQRMSDLLGSQYFHQIARYYTIEHYDRNAAGVNAFSISWNDEVRPYIHQYLVIGWTGADQNSQWRGDRNVFLHASISAHLYLLWNSLFVVQYLLVSSTWTQMKYYYKTLIEHQDWRRKRQIESKPISF